MTLPPPPRRALWPHLARALARLNPGARLAPANPSQELRFTRAAQANHFIVVALICACAAFSLLSLGLWPWYADGSPCLSRWWPGLIPLVPLAACLWLAAYCASHAYIILSPVGVEIFPLWFPSKNFRLIPWHDIAAIQIENSHLLLKFHGPNAGGVILSLRPLRPAQRALLAHAARARCQDFSQT